MLLRCPSCGHPSRQELLTWDNAVAVPFSCPHCDAFHWLEPDLLKELPTAPTSINPRVVGEDVMVINKEHEFFLERGEITKIEFINCRVSFVSQDERINNKQVWMPDHWLQPVPRGW